MGKGDKAKADGFNEYVSERLRYVSATLEQPAANATAHACGNDDLGICRDGSLHCWKCGKKFGKL